MVPLPHSESTAAADSGEIDPAWLGSLLQITDSAYPTGVFAHSGGLEGLVQLGQVETLAELERFLSETVFSGLEFCHLPVLRMSAAATQSRDAEALAHLDEIAAAMLTPEELRLASSRSGRQRLELMETVMHLGKRFPGEWESMTAGLTSRQLPVIAGMEAGWLQIPVSAAMHAYAFGTLSGLLSASMKIMRLGQTSVQEMLYRLTARLPSLIVRSREIDLATLGFFTPVPDIASARHKHAASRLFLS
jgi:urease accessory protein